MSLAQIRITRNVPAKRGGRVFVRSRKMFGTITGSFGGYIRIRLDGEKRSRIYHPTWTISYLEKDGSVLVST